MNGLADDGIAGVVLVGGVPDRRPGAEVGPVETGVDHRGARSLLHHGVVEGNARGLGEGGGVEFDDIAFDLRRRDRRGGSLGNAGRVLADFSNGGLGGQGEVAAVPEITALNVVLGGGAVGLLDKCRDAIDVGKTVERRARANVAVARRRQRGLDSEDDDQAGGGGLGGLRDGGLKTLDVADEVIGGKDEQDRIAVPSRHPFGSNGDSGGGIASLRLENHRGGDTGRGNRFADQRGVLAVGDDDRRAKHRVGDAGQRRGEGRGARDQRQEGFRQHIGRGRPQSGAGATAQNHRDDALTQFAEPHARRPDQMSSRRIRPAVCFSQSRRSTTLAVASAIRLSAAP
jgi:hypothetical protein